MELLVVIGIIAVLIGILLPSLNRARAAAAQAVCLSNVRQLSMGCYSYSVDNKGALVPSASTPGTAFETVNGITGIVTPFWNYASIVAQPGPGTTYSFERGYLGKYLKTEKVLECPALAALDIPPQFPDTPKTAYGIATLSTKCRKFSQVRRSSETATFGDTLKLDTQIIEPQRTTYLSRPSFGTYTPSDDFHGRNPGGTGPVGFFDGHAEAVVCQVRDFYNGAMTPSLRNRLKALRIGPAMPMQINRSLATDIGAYQQLCFSTYDYFFWADKEKKE